MSGHSKWKTIQHKKGAADARRGRVFSRLSKELTVVARQGGGNPETNASLRTVIQKARAANMPADNIERAIKKGTGEIAGVTFEEATYEGYALGGVAVIVQALTDNRNRAAAEIRHIFSRHGSSFAQQGAVTRAFRRRGQIFVDATTVDEDVLMGVILDAGAEDMQRDGEQYEILTDPHAFEAVTQALARAGIATLSADVSLVPDTYVPLSDPAAARAVMRFVEDLEENDDVQNVYTNMDVDDAALDRIEED